MDHRDKMEKSLELFGLFYQHGMRENTLDKTLDLHREYRDQELKEQVEWPSGHQETYRTGLIRAQ